MLSTIASLLASELLPVAYVGNPPVSRGTIAVRGADKL